MMYQTLAHFYDSLVKDDEATFAWVKFIQQHMYGKKILELACGSGEITIALAKFGYQITASDLSSEMVEMAKRKEGSKLVRWNVQDMRTFEDDETYDTILCLCDSFNYILNEQAITHMIKNIYHHLNEHGIFIMDMHSQDRLEEFHEEFFEDGVIDGKGYQWSIISEDDYIYQNFVFFDEQGNRSLEQHIQRVYHSHWIQDILIASGFTVQTYTDFDLDGIQSGEKYFYVCKKESAI